MSFERISVSRSVDLASPIAEVWAVIGDFHGLDRWHPAIASSTREHVGDEEFRLLALEGGGYILEHFEGGTGHSYRYAMLRGPLPVRHYHGSITAEHRAGGTRVTWSSAFEPTDPGAEQIIAGVYDAGLAALKERFGG